MYWSTVNDTFLQMAVKVHVWAHSLFAEQLFKSLTKLHRQQISVEKVCLG